MACALLVVVGGLATAGCLGTTPAPAPEETPTTSAPVAGAAAAVAYAKAQVGLPYCFAGTGPSCFDCSGLTYKAWKAGGVTIPRTSGDQYRAYPKVPLNQLLPGDLLFPSDPNQHVSIYIGSGRMVHATKTGDFIKNVLVSSYPAAYAVRPR